MDWLNRVMSCCYDPGNEPDLLAPWLYIYAGRPDLVDEAVRRELSTAYDGSAAGLPGNDDGGTLSAWYVWASIGLYPDAGQRVVFIGSPLFNQTSITVDGRRRFVIVAPHASTARPYVVSARLDGRALHQASLPQPS